MGKLNFLRIIVFLSIAAVVMLPLYTVLFMYPPFTELIIEDTEKEAVRIAAHISSLLPEKTEFKKDSLPVNFINYIRKIQKDFSLMKVKVFSATGEVVYSTEPKEIGDINKKRYFHEIVAKGNTYTMVVEKNTKSLEAQTVTADVVETYLPIIKGNRVIGALEVYFDITNRKEKLDKLISRSSVTLFTVAVGLLIAVIISSFKARRTISERNQAEEALRESEERLRTITNTAKDAIVMIDNQGNISFWNHAAEKIFGYTNHEAAGKELHVFLGPKKYHETYREGFKRFKETGEGPVVGKTIELKAVRKDGSEFPIELSLSAIQIKGKWHATGIIRDITERKGVEEELKRHREHLTDLVNERSAELIAANEHLQQEITDRMRTEEALHKSEKFLSTIFESIYDPFSIIDRDYRIIKANTAYAQMRDKLVKDLVGKRCYEILQGRDSVCDACVVEKTFKSADPCAKDKLLTFPDGLNVWVEIYTYPIFDENGTVSYVIEYTRDITDRKKAEKEKKQLIEKLEYLSKTDSLTGLLNRRALIDRLEYEIDRTKRYGAELSLILCDMDYFKEINDTHGHAIGDKVLQIVSETISGSLRATDVAGRYGGDEFMVILPETALTGAENLAERIRSSVESVDFQIADEKWVRTSLSLGVTCFNTATEDINTLIKRADVALYASKRDGRNKVRVIDI